MTAPITVFMAAHPGDKTLALQLMKWIAMLGCCKSRSLTLVLDKEHEQRMQPLQELAAKAFGTVSVLAIDPCPWGPRWPRPQNWAFLQVLQWPHQGPFLWLEPDAFPTKQGWLDSLEAEYTKAGKPYMGTTVKNLTAPLPPQMLIGVAIYPPDARRHIERRIINESHNAWDASTAASVVPLAYDSVLFQYVLKPADGARKLMDLRIIKPETALFHGDKFGNLCRMLMLKSLAPSLAAASDAAKKPAVQAHDPIELESASDVTVVITNYKRPEHLKACFESCRAAGVVNLVVSSSGAVAAVEKIQKRIKKFHPSSVITSRRDDAGCNETWLRGVKAARTKRVHILHDDDLLLPSYSKLLTGRIRADIIHTDGAKHGPNGVIEGVYNTMCDLPTGVYPASYLLRFLLAPSGYTLSPVSGIFYTDHVINTLQECQDKFDKRFYLRPTMMVGNDLLLWLRACQRYSTVYYSHTPAISYGHWEGSVSFDDASYNKFGLLPIYKATREYYLRDSPRILHVVQRYSIKDPEQRRRFQQAEATWELAYSNGFVYPRHQWVWSRDSASWADKRQVPFIRDVLKRASDECSPGDIVALTNDDTLANVFLWYHAAHALKTMGAASSFRVNVPKADAVDYVHYPQRVIGTPHCGRDAFFMTREWIASHINELPDYVMTYCDWDSTLDMLIRVSHGNKPQSSEFLQEHPSSNIPTRFVYHEDHEAFWSSGDVRHTHPCNIRCRQLTDEWFSKNLGWPMPDLSPKP